MFWSMRTHFVCGSLLLVESNQIQIRYSSNGEIIWRNRSGIRTISLPCVSLNVSSINQSAQTHCAQAPRPVINKSKPNFWCISLYHAACNTLQHGVSCALLFFSELYSWNLDVNGSFKMISLGKGGSATVKKTYGFLVFLRSFWSIERSRILGVLQ